MVTSRKGYTHGPLAERFWRHVERSRGCWTWTGGLNDAGYGIIGSGGASGRMLRAHRVSWSLAYGAIPAGLFVCHACDNRRCVNPEHLLLGSTAANNLDCVRKGRGRHSTHPESANRGERNGRHKLTAAQVAEVRQQHLAGQSMRRLALAFRVSRPTIRAIVNGEHWRDVA
jgi:hypothetical protein